MRKINNQEREIIKNQLGREPENLGGISRYCPCGKPAVLLTLPYNSDNKGVFPTTYWLSCPYLVKEVSRLEDRGLIRELTDRLENDEEFKRELEEAHQRYARERGKLLSTREIQLLEKTPGIAEVLLESGIGGIREKGGIKCLHTHLADYLAGGENPVGRSVWERLDWPGDCDQCNF